MIALLYANVKAAVRFGAMGLVESSQQCYLQWLYGVHIGDIQYVCIEFKEVIHNIQLDEYMCV